MSQIQITGFEMIEKLGQGGMATVWKARQLSLDRIVAIKVLSSRLSLDPDDVQRFQLEAQSAAKLKHPGIVQVYDAKVESGMYYFVMEHVAGYTVGDWLRRKGVLSEKDTILICECVANALDYAWKNAGIIHCDIKPDNIMVDSDGAIKVADLGLARTISVMSSQSVIDEVLGTPSYMSPEQATGEVDLDCRADIYSLGAMLYHLVTGKLLFEEYSEDRIMEMQVTGTVEDVLDLNPKLSKGFCWLIEEMLAKDKEARPKDWHSVLVNIARVKKGLLPLDRLATTAASTMKRSTKRMKIDHAATGQKQKEETGLPVTLILIVAAVALTLVGIVSFILISKKKSALVKKHEVVATQPVIDSNDREMYEFAKTWAMNNPDEYDKAIKQLKKVAEDTWGTKYSLMAEDEIRRLTKARQEEQEKVLKSLENQAADYVARKEFIEAAKIYETYTGKLAAEIEKRRASIARELRARQDSWQKAERTKDVLIEKRMVQVLDSVVSELATQSVSVAVDIVTRAMADEDLVRKGNELKEIKKLLDGAVSIDDRILESFNALKGRETTVQLSNGKKTFVVIEVKDGKVIGEQKVKVRGVELISPVSFGIGDIAVGERLRLMGSDELPDVALVKGLMALNTGAYSHATKCFEKTHPMLADRLVAWVENVRQKSANENAEKALCELMKLMEISVGSYDQEAWLDAIAKKEFTLEDVARAAEMVEKYRKEHGNADFAKKAKPVLDALMKIQGHEEVWKPSPQEATPVVLLPEIEKARGNQDAVVRILIDRNPEVITNEIKVVTDNQGKPYRIEMFPPCLVDIQPIAALREVREICCGAVSPQRSWIAREPCGLSDISALKGLPLEYLYLDLTEVKDMSSLKGMNLRELHVCRSPVSDLSPLRNMFLEVLDISGTNVKDLTPLKGMKLKNLNISSTKIFDLKSLKGILLESLDMSDTHVKDAGILREMPLKRLNVARTKIFDFYVFKGMSLEYLNVSATQIKDISMLKGMPLRELHVGDTGVNSISVLRDMALVGLTLSGTLVKDFSPIKGMPLRSLSLRNCHINDLSLLEDMPLEWLDISGTNVEDLDLLKKMKLSYLNISNTRVKKLDVIRNLPLVELGCQNVRVRDFRPLMGMPINRIWIDESDKEHVRTVLRSMPQLKLVNGLIWSRN